MPRTREQIKQDIEGVVRRALENIPEGNRDDQGRVPLSDEDIRCIIHEAYGAGHSDGLKEQGRQ